MWKLKFCVWNSLVLWTASKSGEFPSRVFTLIVSGFASIKIFAIVSLSIKKQEFQYSNGCPKFVIHDEVSKWWCDRIITHWAQLQSESVNVRRLFHLRCPNCYWWFLWRLQPDLKIIYFRLKQWNFASVCCCVHNLPFKTAQTNGEKTGLHLEMWTILF